jgi:hypothetical protein
MQNNGQPPTQGHCSLLWLKILSFAVPIILASCVITDSGEVSTSVVIRYDQDGFTAIISLNHSVRLPLDEEDAEFIMAQSDCGCQGELVLVDEYWQYPAVRPAHGCFIRIDIFTGDVDCFSD